MEILDAVMAALRSTSNDEGLIEEASTYVDAAILDLRSTGIRIPEDLNSKEAALVKQAIIVYCKANFGYDNPEATRFNESYQFMKHKLMNTKEFRNEV